MFTEIITIVFCVIIVCLFVYSRFKNLRFCVSNILTTLGVLGTFVGICVGLYNFDVTNIEASVPLLLEGLKMAFLTSIFGLVSSIMVRVLPQKKSDSVNAEDPVQSMIMLFKESVDLQKENNKTLKESLNDIRTSLVGDGDSTLLTQIQKMRTSFADKQDELNRSFKDFAKEMTKHNTEALTEAIQGLVVDFNQKITEQFGENFKALNQAVEKMVLWQAQYKDQVEMMVKQLDNSVEGIQKSEKALAGISDNSQDLISLSSELGKAIYVLTKDIEVFASLADKAGQSLPVIESTIEGLTSGFSAHVKTSIEAIDAQHKIQQDSLEKQSHQLLKSQDEVLQQIKSNVDNTNAQIQKMISSNSERVSKQIEALDVELGRELEKSIQSLGSQLASLSRKFVDDYTPLTERLKEVVQIGQRV